MGPREAAIRRELTKLHEEVSRAPLAELADQADQLETRGEFVLVIGPPAADARAVSAEAMDELLRAQLALHSLKDAVAHAVELTGRPRREVYTRALELAKDIAGQTKGGHGQD
jgi:16S rRNA (cytidine1402-2'-O)-methyltransferase